LRYWLEYDAPENDIASNIIVSLMNQPFAQLHGDETRDKQYVPIIVCFFIGGRRWAGPNEIHHYVSKRKTCVRYGGVPTHSRLYILLRLFGLSNIHEKGHV